MRKLTLAFLGALLLAAPAPARADWFVSPFVGGHFSGDASHKNTAVGIAGGWLGGGWLGVEGDFGWAPQFFEQDGFKTERQMTTLMGNVIVAVPSGSRESFRPYVSGGLGVIRPRLSEAGGFFALTGKNKLATDVGGGATGFFTRNVGVRGDIRYFRGLRTQDTDANDFNLDLSTFHFWRASTGVVVRF
jgi:outer membrane protein with beta-barrel domain